MYTTYIMQGLQNVLSITTEVETRAVGAQVKMPLRFFV